MSPSDDRLRQYLAALLNWEQAHVGFDSVVDRIPTGSRGKPAPGFEHSAWQLLEHMRVAQHDLLDYCRNAQYKHTLTWPNDYWPVDPEPPTVDAWVDSVAAFRADRDALQHFVQDTGVDLFARVPAGEPSHTVLRSILIVADHNAYHLGQVVAVCRALGIWQ